MAEILVVDSSELERTALERLLGDWGNVTSCESGAMAVHLLRERRFDAMVLELMLPVEDGISILQRGQGHLPEVIVATSRFSSDYMLQAAQDLGVGSVMLMPCSAEAVAARLQTMLQRRTRPFTVKSPQQIIADLLQTLGVPEKLSGYHQLRIGVPYYAQDPDMVGKELYQAIADRCGKGDYRQVERSIRSAIAAAWKDRDEEVWGVYFPPDQSGTIRRPTNKAFIARLADFLMQD